MAELCWKRNITHLRTLLYTRLQRIPKSIFLCSFNAPANKLIINRLFHKNPRSCYTTLSLVVEHTNMGKFHSSIHCKEMQILSDHEPACHMIKSLLTFVTHLISLSRTFYFYGPLKHRYTSIYLCPSGPSQEYHGTHSWAHIQVFYGKCRFKISCPVRSTKKSIETEG